MNSLAQPVLTPERVSLQEMMNPENTSSRPSRTSFVCFFFFLEDDGKMDKLSGNVSASPRTTHATREGRDAHSAKPVEELKGTFKVQVQD